jgi:hypothetical protein
LNGFCTGGCILTQKKFSEKSRPGCLNLGSKSEKMSLGWGQYNKLRDLTYFEPKSLLKISPSRQNSILEGVIEAQLLAPTTENGCF